MLIDYVSPEKLPPIVFWLDWCLHSYWSMLIVFWIVSSFHYLGTAIVYSSGGYFVSVLAGFCAWVVFCAYYQGYGLG